MAVNTPAEFREIGDEAPRRVKQLLLRAQSNGTGAAGSWHTLADGRVGLLIADARGQKPKWHFSIHDDKYSGLQKLRAAFGDANAYRAGLAKVGEYVPGKAPSYKHTAGDFTQKVAIRPKPTPQPTTGFLNRAVDAVASAIEHPKSPFKIAANVGVAANKWLEKQGKKVGLAREQPSLHELTQKAHTATLTADDWLNPRENSVAPEVDSANAEARKQSLASKVSRRHGDSQNARQQHIAATKAHMQVLKSLESSGASHPEAILAHREAARAHYLAANAPEMIGGREVQLPPSDPIAAGRKAVKESLRWYNSIPEEDKQAYRRDLALDNQAIADRNAGASPEEQDPLLEDELAGFKGHLRAALKHAQDGDYQLAHREHYAIQNLHRNLTDLGTVNSGSSLADLHKQASDSFGRHAPIVHLSRERVAEAINGSFGDLNHGGQVHEEHYPAVRGGDEFHRFLSAHPSGKTLEVAYRPKYNLATVDFRNDSPALEYKSAPEVQSGSVDFVRRLKNLGQRLAESGVNVGYASASDKRREQAYHKVLSGAGLKYVGKVPIGSISVHAYSAHPHAQEVPFEGDSTTPTRLARTPGASVANAVRGAMSKDQSIRRMIASKIAKEAGLKLNGLTDAIVTGNNAKVRDSLVQRYDHASEPEWATLAAAYYGLLTREPRTAAFHVHPDGGPDTLHIWHTDAKPEDVRTGADRLNIPHVVSGLDGMVYSIDKGNRYAGQIAKLQQETKSGATNYAPERGYVHYLGAGSGSDADARSSYRSVIRAAQGG
jgi:hypothetical protein